MEKEIVKETSTVAKTRVTNKVLVKILIPVSGEDYGISTAG